MKKKSIAAAFLSALVLCCAPAVAGGTDSGRTPASHLEAQAERALDSLREAYVERNADKFFQSVHPETSQSVTALRSDLSRRFADFSQIELDFSTDHVLSEGGKVLLKTRWQRRRVHDSDGRVETARGGAELLFKPFEEGMALADVSGDMPF